MARKVFFSFHFKRDAWRAGQVRNSDLLPNEDEYGVIDGVEWEKIERAGDDAIRRWINDQLKYTSVTAVLIGAETSERDWVDYEIRQSWDKGNGLIGIRIHNLKDQEGKIDMPGSNPLDNVKLVNGSPLSSIFKTYDWNTNDGRNNLGSWVEEAFQLRERYSGESRLNPSTQSTQSISSGLLGRTAPTVIQNPPRPWAN